MLLSDFDEVSDTHKDKVIYKRPGLPGTVEEEMGGKKSSINTFWISLLRRYASVTSFGAIVAADSSSLSSDNEWVLGKLRPVIIVSVTDEPVPNCRLAARCSRICFQNLKLIINII